MTQSKQVPTFWAPALYGYPLLAAANLLEWSPTIAQKIARDAHFFALRDVNDLTEPPTTLPIPSTLIDKRDRSTEDRQVSDAVYVLQSI